MRKKTYIITLFLAISKLSAQHVGINTTTPDTSSVLDIVSNSKGLLAPRVSLDSSTMDLDGNPGQAEGLLVYNTGTVLPKGYYFWNGTEWRTIDNSTSIAPSVAGIDCTTAILSPSTYTAGTPFTGIMKVSYTGGNGGNYSGGSTITVNGLDFKLQGGQLAVGTGELIFNVTGTPTITSPISTTVPINSTSVSFFSGSCNAVIGGQDTAEIKTVATMGPLRLTNDPAAGYDRILTTPDGKFSVRVVVSATAPNNGFDLADLQIRSNSGTPTIMWNAGIEYVSNGQFVNGNNGMTFPAQGVWYGNSGGNGTTMGSTITNAWGDPDVYYNSPEYRRYTWTTTDPSDQTMYILTFMMGAANFGPANATNCPNGVCSTTKAFLKIDQIRSIN
ncbi:hypothetical protein [Chryseobacterium oryctis]|uniref:DUF1554 domain-containing protein n=1 Tax=Chryseobacterium oryctis TaxID=2952618 RepID=A0ABT3HQ47_9FLAO|nr:hypothetical protein [Chryseobacterium oryctis]MCW3161910.1 hypothetical protein [Chryseobacterium oryctis]